MAGDLLNGRWLLGGGRDNNNLPLDAVAWNPASNSWSAVSGMPEPASATGAGSIGSAFYVLGGNNGTGFTARLRRYLEAAPCPTNTPTVTTTNTPTRTPTITPTPTPTATSTATRT